LCDGAPFRAVGLRSGELVRYLPPVLRKREVVCALIWLAPAGPQVLGLHGRVIGRSLVQFTFGMTNPADGEDLLVVAIFILQLLFWRQITRELGSMVDRAIFDVVQCRGDLMLVYFGATHGL